jgi:putative sigma-54 modulation protein
VRIQISGRHVSVTEAMKDYARDKIEKLERIHGRMTKVEVTLDVGHDRTIVEIVASATRHAHLVCKAESPDMYAAIDLAEDKLARQLVRHKSRLNDHHRGDGHHGGDGAVGGLTPGADGSTPAETPEETYEEIVEKLRDTDVEDDSGGESK